MLSDDLARVRRAPAPTLLTLVCGLLAGIALGAIFDDGGASGVVRVASRSSSPVNVSASTTVSRSGARHLNAPTAALPPASAGSNGSSTLETANSQTLKLAVRRGVREAEALGGHASMAVWVDGAEQPAFGGDVSKPGRMWSMSKAVATIAALEATDDEPDRQLASAMVDAITRSSNCGVRRVILGLQQRVGPTRTFAAFDSVLARANVSIERAPQTATAEAQCIPYLESHRAGLSGSPLAAAPQLGTVEWTTADAIAFASALAHGVYGRPGAYLLRLMRRPKQPPQPPLEEAAPPDPPPLDWGAGAVFPASWQPGWKGGWGGSQDIPARYLAGQIVALDIHGVPVAATAMFYPSTQPPNDNPGVTTAPRALEIMFRAAREGLEAGEGLH